MDTQQGLEKPPRKIPKPSDIAERQRLVRIEREKGLSLDVIHAWWNETHPEFRCSRSTINNDIKLVDAPGKRRSGRPPTPPELSPNYTRLSTSLPLAGWQNLDRLAERGNMLARSGPRFDKPSFRRLLYQIAMVDAPRILAYMEEHQIVFSEDSILHFTIDLEAMKEETNGTSEGSAADLWDDTERVVCDTAV